MLTEVRWEKEQELMRSVFPEFKPFSRGRNFGFEGYLKGPRTGRVYRVAMDADPLTYPQWPPDVELDPKLGDHWIDRRRHRALCVVRNWQPARSTFANTLLTVVGYLDEHDGVSSCAARHGR